MLKKFQVITILSACFVLFGCDDGPSEKEITKALNDRYEQRNNLIKHSKSPIKIESIEKLENCKVQDASSNVYVCPIKIIVSQPDRILPIRNKFFKDYNLEMRKENEEWVADEKAWVLLEYTFTLTPALKSIQRK
ncbi:hypothetical protein GKR50_01530 [Providencia rustigianii]|uniref:hypothetical protein n=1 Tax=Providencia rustigianii TaxID=158850 RepID=UPI000F6EB0D6|nr:hypothetical protein [Providencia rustigianii]MTC58703.1 hypothetical protein [Providencia rustigianii]VEH54516.1 Uncharacterised protein [Providencia rustigianii]